MRKLKQNWNFLATRSLALCIVFSIVFALSVSSAFAVSAELSQSYIVSGEVSTGALVSLSDGNENEVVLAEPKNSDSLIGVSVAKGDSLIAVNAGDSSIQVATSGRAIVLVSNINGDIEVGDLLGLSAVRGVGAKAVAGSRLVGIAGKSFDSNSPGAKTREVKDNSGVSRDIVFGAIPMTISIGSKVSLPGIATTTGVLGWFETVAGKPVTNLRLAFCAIIAVIMLVVMSTMIFGSIRTTIYGVSRNPFAKSSIFDALTQVIVLTMVVAMLGITIIYVILRV